ncbi:NAD(P)-binding domain-containing protein, partial [Halomonas sp. SIMBA_159]
QVEAVVFEPSGVLEGLTPNSGVVDCPPAFPSATAQVAAKVVKAGGRFRDAAMTRAPKGAAEGRLELIVGAPKVLFD